MKYQIMKIIHLRNTVVSFITLVFPILFMSSCISDRSRIKKESIGKYISEKSVGELFSNQSKEKITLILHKDGSYIFNPEIDYIDASGKWTLFKEGLVRYIVLENQDGSKDRISTCCSEEGKITYYYYLNEKEIPNRIIFNKVK